MIREIPSDNIIDLKTADGTKWDVIIVGTGMGGGCVAKTLAESGYKVLALDKGAANFDGDGESVSIEPETKQQQYINGKWPTQIRTKINGRDHDMWAPLGCGVGGSSLLYAAALQRLRKDDFESRPSPNGVTGETLSWPFSYEEIEPYYQKAENIFSVCGTPDPLEANSTYCLNPPPAMCEQDRNLFQSFESAGYHPYRLHVGIQYKPDCLECGGHICQRQCKRDAYNSCVVPALATQNLFVAEYAEVELIDANENEVKSLQVHQNENDYTLSAKIIVLSAGAYFTPLLLMKSRNQVWPNGLANKSGHVGKNLMFHASDFLGIWPTKKCSREGPNKTIALRDLYSIEDKKIGEFQSTGLAADYGLVLFSLRLMFDQSRFSKLTPIRQFLRIPAYIASKLYGEATVFTTIVEDYPYVENCVVEDENAPSGMRFEYTIHEELENRVALMRKHIRSTLKGMRTIPMNIVTQLNYGHPCGTCRAGADPETSVVDKNGKAHDLSNLYIVDASFMPTSGGTNPSLTIAANALRIADAIVKDLSLNSA